jgi:hypothetical protein
MPDRDLAPLARVLALFAALGLGATLTACADIQPAPDDPGAGMLESPTDEADQFRRAEERAQEDHEEGEGRRQ